MEDIDIIRLTSSEELEANYEGIAALFYGSFDKKIDRALWQWAYINNPYGSPIVTVAKSLGKVVGHYAVVPMGLINQSGDRLNGFLSMTTMVHADYRRLKLFQRLADDVYDQIDRTKNPSVAFGFPNDNSAPGFRKKLSWEVDDEYRVVTVPFKDVTVLERYLSQLKTPKSYSIDLSKDEYKQWRSQKPQQEWDSMQAFSIKSFTESQDLMFVNSNPVSLAGCSEKSINVTLPISESLMRENGWKELFPYRFGYRAFNCENDPKFFVQMSMSDIF